MADDDFQDIHDALGIITHRPVLTITPSGAPHLLGNSAPGAASLPNRGFPSDYLQGTGQGGSRTPNDLLRDVYYAAWRGRITGNESRTPTEALNDWIQDVNARRGSNLEYPTRSVDDWRRAAYQYMGPLPALSRGHQDENEAAQLPPRRNALTEPQPSLSDRAIRQQLESNPGASIFDIAGSQQTPEAAQRAEQLRAYAYERSQAPAQAVQTTSGPLGELSSAVRGGIQKLIGPHMSEQDFKDKFFGGMHSQAGTKFDYSPANGQLNIEARLVDPETGQRIGSMNREIDPSTGRAYHGYLSIQQDSRGTGLVPKMLQNQVELYKKMGLDRVEVSADLDVGKYAWAKYGFLPKTNQDWDYHRDAIRYTLDAMRPDLSPEQYTEVRKLTDSPDKHALWGIADLSQPAPANWKIAARTAARKDTTLGQALLTRSGAWPGKLDLTDEDSMERFNDYIGSK